MVCYINLLLLKTWIKTNLKIFDLSNVIAQFKEDGLET